MRWILAGAAAFGLIMAGAAAASPQKPKPRPDPVVGVWEFKTEPYGGGCVMSGRMTIRPAVGGAPHTCTFVAYENCPDVKVRADQTCTATKVGDKLSIKATIIKVEPQVSYAPDDWELTVIDAGRMRGELRSADIAPVIFYRGEALVS